MYARLTLYKTEPGPGLSARLESLTSQVGSVMRQQKGFIRAVALRDETSGEFGGISLWETRADAEAAGEALRSAVQQGMAQALGAPTVRLFEAVEL